jgi:hypothetical protein
MTRYGSVCLLLGSLSWYQATSSRSALEAQTNATAETTVRNLGHELVAANIALDKPLITIAGLCDNPSADKAVASNCKTVITRAQFEKLIDAIQPNMRAHARREFALHYADVLVMTKRAEQMGLDKGANYEERMRLARIQVLSQELKEAIQEKAALVSDKEVEDYYRNNVARFEKAEIDRIYIPKTQQTLSVSDNRLSEDDRQKRSRESEQVMKEEAENLRARAGAGEDFAKLQAEAYQAAGIRSAVPNTSMVIRRISLPTSQVLVMDLKPGEVSSVLADLNGYDIYKIKTKDTLPLDQVREEIRSTLRSQHMQNEMNSIQNSATTTLDESYFGRSRSQ